MLGDRTLAGNSWVSGSSAASGLLYYSTIPILIFSSIFKHFIDASSGDLTISHLEICHSLGGVFVHPSRSPMDLIARYLKCFPNSFESLLFCTIMKP